MPQHKLNSWYHKQTRHSLFIYFYPFIHPTLFFNSMIIPLPALIIFLYRIEKCIRCHSSCLHACTIVCITYLRTYVCVISPYFIFVYQIFCFHLIYLFSQIYRRFLLLLSLLISWCCLLSLIHVICLSGHVHVFPIIILKVKFMYSFDLILPNGYLLHYIYYDYAADLCLELRNVLILKLIALYVKGLVNEKKKSPATHFQ